MLHNDEQSVIIKDTLQACQQQTGLELCLPSSTLTPITNGWSNQNYLLTTEHQQFVLRCNSTQSSAICNRNNEIQCWNIAAEAGLAPELFWVSENQQFYLSQYLPQPNNPQFNHQQRLTLLQSLTALPLPKYKISTTQQWQSYHQKIIKLDEQITEQSNFSHSTPWLKMHEYWQKLNRALFINQTQIATWLNEIEDCQIRPQYCHRDLNKDNILIHNEQLMCIDFEYACASHPLYELAAVICSHNLPSNEKDLLIKQYLTGHPNLTPHATSTLNSTCKMFWIFFHCWASLMMGNTLLTYRRDSDVVAKEKIEQTFYTYYQYTLKYPLK